MLVGWLLRSSSFDVDVVMLCCVGGGQGGTKRCSAVAMLHENLSFGPKILTPNIRCFVAKLSLSRIMHLNCLKFLSKIFLWHFRLKFSSQIFV